MAGLQPGRIPGDASAGRSRRGGGRAARALSIARWGPVRKETAPDLRNVEQSVPSGETACPHIYLISPKWTFSGTLFASRSCSVVAGPRLAGSVQERRAQTSFFPGVNSRACTDRKSTRLNSSHLGISYAVFCLKKKKEPSLAALAATRERFFGPSRRSVNRE